MDDLRFGTRNKRWDYTPNDPLQTGPLLSARFDFGWHLLFLRCRS